VAATLDGHTASLRWPDGSGVLELPAALTWTAHRGEEHPPLGWYSAAFGRREPATTLVGTGRTGATPLTTLLCFTA
jgi:hypothetical protein